MIQAASNHIPSLDARAQRARERKARITTYRAEGFEDAERWDLDFWQARTPQERLSALVDIREDVAKVEQSKQSHEKHS